MNMREKTPESSLYEGCLGGRYWNGKILETGCEISRTTSEKCGEVGHSRKGKKKPKGSSVFRLER